MEKVTSVSHVRRLSHYRRKLPGNGGRAEALAPTSGKMLLRLHRRSSRAGGATKGSTVRISRLWIASLLFTGLLSFGCRAEPVNLDTYIKSADNSFSWSMGERQNLGGVELTELRMRSQTWRGIPWDHVIQIYRPANVKYPRTCLLLITGGNPSPSSSLLAISAANALQAPAAVLYNIPNQPLFDGKSEDDLIAHTFDEYFKTGDPTWPLLLPMTRSAVRAMDAVQQFSQRDWKEPVDRFVVTGASKRGWTTYLTGAVDPRVAGIAPIVFDNLNFTKQMPRQLELWGRYSEQIQDYTRRGLQQKMDTVRGRELTRAVDPWHYRDRLTMPKLLIHGSNDPYWATDAVSLYWDELKGPKSLLVVPNAGHGVPDLQRVIEALGGFFHAVAANRPFPQLKADVEEKGDRITLRVTSDMPATSMSVWTSRAAGLDFRPERWEESPMKKSGEGFEVTLQRPAEGGFAFFAEATFELEGDRFRLSTPTRVIAKQADRAAR